jgi:UDP-galactopyranose mutase
MEAKLPQSKRRTPPGKRRLTDRVLNPAIDRSAVLSHYSAQWANSLDLLCFSHLRWDFVFQRPQHLLTRFAKYRRVFFFEEPIHEDGQTLRLEVSRRENNLFVVVPHIPREMTVGSEHAVQQQLLDALLTAQKVREYVAWYYTPMALGFTRHLRPRAVVYDCMDELSAFKGAPPSLLDHEAELIRRAHVVFTGGQSLYEAKKDRHENVHAFPSSIDRAHFEQARTINEDPADQRDIPHPRIGFAGVIDERMDIDLLGKIAEIRPDWHFVMIGPVVKIDPAHLPQRANIHYLGAKHYNELPSYMAGWDAAMLPFARNESTRFISPTKTPEYLAAGRPVISTSIRDVVRPYGEKDFVKIADAPEDFVAKLEGLLSDSPENTQRRKDADAFLAQISWDQTWQRMSDIMASAVLQRLNRRQGSNLARPADMERRKVTLFHEGRFVRFFDRRDMESAR